MVYTYRIKSLQFECANLLRLNLKSFLDDNFSTYFLVSISSIPFLCLDEWHVAEIFMLTETTPIGPTMCF